MRDTPPLVSVVVPAFNAAPFIADTLKSVLAQTHRHLEVLVVDDGSTDETPALVEDIARRDTRVVFIRQLNQGVAKARNLAIERARGEFVAPVDADDIWLPDKLEKQVACLERGGPEYGLCYTWWFLVDEAGRRLTQSHPWHIDGEVPDVHVALNFIGNASVPLIRRECFDRVGGYNPEFRAQGGQGCEDWDLSLRIAEQYRIALVPEYLAGYRRVAGSMSADFDTMIRSHVLMLEQLTRRRPDVPARMLRWSRGLMYWYIAMICIRSGNYLEAAKWVARGVLSPSVSYASPWILEVMLTKMPAVLAKPLIRLMWWAFRVTGVQPRVL